MEVTILCPTTENLKSLDHSKKRKGLRVSFDPQAREAPIKRACDSCRKFTDLMCSGFDIRPGLSEEDLLLLPKKIDHVRKVKHSVCDKCLNGFIRCHDCEESRKLCMQELEKNKEIMNQALSMEKNLDIDSESDSDSLDLNIDDDIEFDLDDEDNLVFTDHDLDESDLE